MLQIKIVSDFLNDIIFEYSNIEELKEKFNKFNDINNYILSNLEIFDEENNKLDNSNIKILVNSDEELEIQQIDINTLNLRYIDHIPFQKIHKCMVRCMLN